MIEMNIKQKLQIQLCANLNVTYIRTALPLTNFIIKCLHSTLHNSTCGFHGNKIIESA